MPLNKGNRRLRRRGRDLIQECEAYLAGQYVGYLEVRNEHVPNWAWLNVLAHGDPARFRSLVAENSLYGGVRIRTSVLVASDRIPGRGDPVPTRR